MTDASQMGAPTRLELSASELETVRQALKLLLDTLTSEEAEQIDEIQALLSRLPGGKPGA